MPDASTLLARTASLPGWLAQLGVTLLLIALWIGRRHAAAARRCVLELGVHAERAAIVGIVAYVLVTRLAFFDSPVQPRLYFSQAGPLQIAQAMKHGDRGREWLAQLTNVQVVWEYHSPIMGPVAAAVQRALGPVQSLPTLVGGCWSLFAVLVAWRLGRSAESPVFGVLLAGLVAVSPLQLTWARLGGIYIGASAHVLLVLWCGWLVGRRRGVLAALLLGVLAWSSVYHYFAARIGIVLAPLALWAGWRRGNRGAGRLAALVAAFALGLAGCIALHRVVNPGQSLWPSYPGYVGNRGESDRWQLLASAATELRGNTGRALHAYFWRDRMGPLAASIAPAASPWTGTLLQADMSGGGLAPLPVVLLGLLGLLLCLRHPLERGLWLGFAIASFLPIVLGPPTARRFLVFDLAWCAFAAFGLRSLLESRLVAGLSARARGILGAATVGALGIWSAAAVALAAAALPPFRTPIPFGESGFGDGLTCRACVQTGGGWQHEIEGGRMVILFDTDLDRENRTAPGGLWLYGKLAGLAAGRPDRFLDFYALLSNFDAEQPLPGPLGPHPPDDVPAALDNRIAAAAPSAIVWWFSQPSAWERAVAVALVGAGSSLSSPPFPPTGLGDRPSALAARPLRVETPWERRADALRALRGLTEPPPAPDCVRLERVARQTHTRWPLAITPLAGAAGQPPQWGIASWHDVQVGTTTIPAVEVIGFESVENPDGTPTMRLLDFYGTPREWIVGGTQRTEAQLSGPRPIGRDCAALAKGQWWIVDPIAGTLVAPEGRTLQAPLTGVMGITSRGDDRLLVATADQRLHLVDPAGLEPARSMPAAVAPTRRFHYGECAMLASGDGWVASFDQMRGLLYVYDDEGMPLGRVSLTSAAGSSPLGLRAIRGAGDYLGVAHDLAVTTFRVVPDLACARAAAGRP